eukprot:2525589-Pleurochrysis_carterae.AAC.1
MGEYSGPRRLKIGSTSRSAHAARRRRRFSNEPLRTTLSSSKRAALTTFVAALRFLAVTCPQPSPSSACPSFPSARDRALSEPLPEVGFADGGLRFAAAASAV